MNPRRFVVRLFKEKRTCNILKQHRFIFLSDSTSGVDGIAGRTRKISSYTPDESPASGNIIVRWDNDGDSLCQNLCFLKNGL
jgi:hypothetical protein